METYYYGRKLILTESCSRFSSNTHFCTHFWLWLSIPYELWSWSIQKNPRSTVSWYKSGNRRTDTTDRSILLTNAVGKKWITHIHTRLTAVITRYQKGKTIWILLKQETVSGSGISWAICKSAPRSRQITMPAPHHSVFYRPDALPAAQPDRVKALKALKK